jgi:hypothetical protein
MRYFEAVAASASTRYACAAKASKRTRDLKHWLPHSGRLRYCLTCISAISYLEFFVSHLSEVHITPQITGRQKWRLVCVKWSEAKYTNQATLLTVRVYALVWIIFSDIG